MTTMPCLQGIFLSSETELKKSFIEISVPLDAEAYVDKRVVWTVTADHFETGCGRTLMALFTWAETKEEALQAFADKFGDYLARGAEAGDGVIENPTIAFLYSPAAIENLKLRAEQRASLDVYSHFHFNLS